MSEYKSKKSLLAELKKLRQRVADLEAGEIKRAQAEEAPRESEERYRALLELGERTGEAVVMLQDDERGIGMHVYASEEWSQITGYSINELLNMSMVELLHSNDRKEAIKRHEKRMRGEVLPGLYEITIIRKDGAEVPVEVPMLIPVTKESQPM